MQAVWSSPTRALRVRHLRSPCLLCRLATHHEPPQTRHLRRGRDLVSSLFLRPPGRRPESTFEGRQGPLSLVLFVASWSLLLGGVVVRGAIGRRLQAFLRHNAIVQFSNFRSASLRCFLSDGSRRGNIGMAAEEE